MSRIGKMPVVIPKGVDVNAHFIAITGNAKASNSNASPTNSPHVANAMSRVKEGPSSLRSMARQACHAIRRRPRTWAGVTVAG